MKISVIITCYNEKEYIGDSVRSVLGQSRFDIIDNVIIVDDGSDDGSREVIREIGMENQKLEYVFQENQGLPGARNTALERCTGDFVAFQDGDDIWLEHKIERQAQVIEEYPDVGLVYSDFYLFGMGDQKRVTPNRYKYSDGDILERFFLKGGPIIPSTVLVNSECLHTIGKFDPKLLRAQDTDLWLRIAEKYRFHHISDPLVMRRQRDDSLGKSHRKKAMYQMQVTDKAISRSPRLQPLAEKRKAMILASRGRQLLDESRRWEAVWILKKAFMYDPSSLEAQASLVFSLLPLPMWGVQKIIHIARKLAGAIKSA